MVKWLGVCAIAVGIAGIFAAILWPTLANNASCPLSDAKISSEVLTVLGKLPVLSREELER